MKKTNNNNWLKKQRQLFILLFFVIFIISCREKENPISNIPLSVSINKTTNPITYNFPQPSSWYSGTQNDNSQIAEYVRRIFQDKKGNLWFGTNGLGVAKFDGKNLNYFSSKNGFSGDQVTSIMEDNHGNMWFTTSGGVSKYDGKSVTNFSMENGLNDNWAWRIFQDSNENIWAGTLKGLCRLVDDKFITFNLPPSNVKNPTSALSTKRITSIIEDKKGDLWFGTDGHGAYKYNGKSFKNITRKDGLCDNNITSILEDRNGNLWFGSMNGGISKFDGELFTNFTVNNGIGN
ncbi:MAG: hypothetical protein IZT56_14550, partial [Bacteroidetes bacterium]|nr:hypothetical protein [Bacteroidota bacterium]